MTHYLEAIEQDQERDRQIQAEIASNRALVDAAFAAGWRAHQRQGLALTVDKALEHWRGMRGEK